MRRLPVYLVLDCSESMAGKTFELMKRGVQTLLADLRRDPQALELAYVSLITFASRSKVLVPLTELSDFRMPELVLGSGTALGDGLDLLKKQMEKEIVKTTAGQKGDCKPLIFLMTDGEPTDSYRVQADWLLHNTHLQSVVIGVGEDVNPQTLLSLSETVIHINDSNDVVEENFSRFFKWVSASVSTASAQIGGGEQKKIDLRKFSDDQEITIIDEQTPKKELIPNRFVFIHSKCIKSGNLYLIKYKKENRGDYYQFQESIPLEQFDFTPQDGILTIQSENLNGEPVCPYCGNKGWAHCICDHIFCSPAGGGILTCPWCYETNSFSPASFSLGGGAG